MTKEREAIAPSRVSGSYYTDRLGFTDQNHEASEEEIMDVITRFAGAASRAVPGGTTRKAEPGSGRTGEVCHSAYR